ncbi:hypothetical protein [Sorangium sp. So ce1078]|uniref:hypothetical protein n=1 Tax=Sorangium sp. So ce1078 TaxID=3133329 RepID=UPI003F5E45DF
MQQRHSDPRRRPVKAPVHLFDGGAGRPPEPAPAPRPEAPASPALERALGAFRSDGVRARGASFADDLAPPRLRRALNDPDLFPDEDGAPDDPQAIALLLLDRARDVARLARAFEHGAYRRFDARAGEAWARAVAEHLTGIPVADPARVYAEGRPAIARALFIEGRVPLAALSEDAVTAALCVGGWDGGRHGDIGRGLVGLERCRELGEAIPSADVPELLRPFQEWGDALWDRVAPGACLFWEGATAGAGRVAIVLRKHDGGAQRALQLWGTPGLSEVRAGDPAEPEALVEGELWTRLPDPLETGTEALRFCGVGLLPDLGAVRADLRPRGRARLILRRRSDGELLYRSAWLSMEAEGLSIARLLGSLRGSPRAAEIEAVWRVHSLCLTPTPDVPDSVFLLECAATKRGRAELRVAPDRGAGAGADEPGAYLHGGGKAEF